MVFDFVEFNRLSFLVLNEIEATLIAALDCSFIPKSGKHTEELGKFYNSVQGAATKGLEISTLAVVNVTENTAYNLSTRQPPATSHDDETRIDAYLDHLKQDRKALPASIRLTATTAKRNELTVWPRLIFFKSASCAVTPIYAGFIKANKSRF